MKPYLLSLSLLALVPCHAAELTPASDAPVVVESPRHETIYIVRSRNDFKDLLIPTLQYRMKHLGHPTEVVSRPPSDGAPYLTYTATWSWDEHPVLYHFTAEIHRAGQVVDMGEYDENAQALKKGFDYNPRRRTELKVKPVLSDLVKHLDVAQK